MFSALRRAGDCAECLLVGSNSSLFSYREIVLLEIIFEFKLGMWMKKLLNFSRRIYRGEFTYLSHRIRSLLYDFKRSRALQYKPTKNNKASYTYPARESKELLVSIIVPNFNHAPFLRQRLESIFSQTYKNFEVILLDDSSRDSSSEILKEFQQLFPEKTKLALNDKNSGSVFRQWEKGIKLAKGDLIWIAESDDYCDLTFLETLVPFFFEESVTLAFSRSDFVDQHGKKVWDTEEYLGKLDRARWADEFTLPAKSIVLSYFHQLNIIPNVSSAIFRNPSEHVLFQDPMWLGMKVCGDWIFYLNIISGGSISYSHRTTNYYRQHLGNTSVSSYSKDTYYSELHMVAAELMRLYPVGLVEIDGLWEKAKTDWLSNRPKDPLKRLEDLFKLQKLKDLEGIHLPLVGMCSYGFTTGGGETFPIKLANSLFRMGHPIVFISFDLAPINHGIRHLLNPAIPVFHVKYLAELESIVRSFGIDILHSHQYDIDLIISSFNLKHDIKHVITLHGMYETIPKEEIEKKLPKLVATVSKWAYVADKNLQPFKSGGFNTEAFINIPNAVESKEQNREKLISRDNLQIPDQAFVVCLVSRAIKEKGWHEAVEIISRARDKSDKDLRLILIGDGPVLSEVQKIKKDYIHVLGFQKDVTSYFGISNVGLLPSTFRGESFPLTILECLSEGKPVLATAVGEIRNMLSIDENSTAGEVFDLVEGKVPIDQVIDKLIQYMNDSVVYEMKCSLAKLASKKFDLKNMSSLYQKTYIEIMKEPVFIGENTKVAE